MMARPYFSAASAQSQMAVNWGTPMPETTRVVQMEPGPMPTLTTSAPASNRSAVAAAVATLPAMMGRFGKAFLTMRTL